jgi:hypothetical protein
MAKKQESDLQIDEKAKRGTVILRAGFFGQAGHPSVEQIERYTNSATAGLAAGVVPPKDAALMPSEVAPKPDDFVTRNWRLLSQTIVERGHFLDFSTPGVLEAAVPLAKGITVYKNHWCYDSEEWVGLVAETQWDATGANSDGIAGINGTVLIDAVQAPKIARGVLVNAINSGSVGVVFEYEYSHPTMVAEKGYWFFRDLLGTKVDDQIVRFIVTKILEFPEFSIVPRGGDKYANVQPDNDGEDGLTAGLAAKPTAISKEKTVKLSATQITALGLTGIEGHDFPESEVLSATDKTIAALNSKATSFDSLIEAQRTTARNQAFLASGAKEGEALNVADELAIANATPEQLTALTTGYAAKVAQLFPQTCQSCGKAAISGQSSVNTEMASGVAPLESVDVSGLHG